MGAVVTVVFIAGFVWLLVWMNTTENGKAYAAKAKVRRESRRAATRTRSISEVGVKSDAGLSCPKCHGTQFKAHRKTSTKLAFGAASLLGQAKHVRCVTCGTDYLRG